jgi:hypothetical protein
MAKKSLSDRLLGESLIAERTLRELKAIRVMSHPQAVRWLDNLMLDIRRAEGEFLSTRASVETERGEAILAIGLVGIALASPPGPASDLSDLWDRAITQVEKWYGLIAPRETDA